MQNLNFDLYPIQGQLALPVLDGIHIISKIVVFFQKKMKF